MKYFLAFNASICKGLLCTSSQAKSWRETAPNISTSCSVCPEPVLLQMCPASYQPSNGCKIMFLSKYIFPAAGLCLELARMFALVFGSRVCEGCVQCTPIAWAATYCVNADSRWVSTQVTWWWGYWRWWWYLWYVICALTFLCLFPILRAGGAGQENKSNGGWKPSRSDDQVQNHWEIWSFFGAKAEN